MKGRLPSLREVRIAGYTWPIEECAQFLFYATLRLYLSSFCRRDIDKDVIVKHAIHIKTEFSEVNITDARGQPWRLRAERRR